MIKPAVPENEKKRIQTLLGYEILDTLPEQEFDDLTKIAASICGVPISLVSLVDPNRQWFKSHHGLDATETPRDIAFCAHAINEPDDVFIIEDASKDERFFDNPLSINNPNVVFYAGAPLLTKEGLAMGTLCVIDNKPRELTKNQIESLKALARQVVNQMEYRKNVLVHQREILKRKKENQFIAKTSDLLELTIEAAPTGMLMIKEGGSIVLANSLIDELFGYSRKELVGSSIEMLMPSRFKEGHTRHRTGFFQNPEKRSMGTGRILYARKKDGTEFPVEIGLNPITTSDGNFVLSSIIDITERKKAEEELKRSEKFFTMSLNMVAVAHTDGFFKKINPAFTNVLGWSENELLKKPFIEFIHPEDIPATLKEVEKLSGGAVTIGFENRYRCKDDTYRIFNWTVAPNTKTGELFCVAYDVTELTSTQKKLQKLSLDFEGELDAIDTSAAKVELDMNGIIVDANENFLKIVGYSKVELTDKHHSILLDEEYGKSKEYVNFWNQLNTGKFVSGEFKRRTKTGETAWIHGSYNPVLDSAGKPYKVVKIAYDITLQKQNELLVHQYSAGLEAANKELDQFAYIVSHDLKAPLRGISSLATFIAEDYSDKLDDAGKEQISMLQNRVSRMNGLITGILDYSRIGRAKQEKENVDLKKLVDNIVDLVVPPDFNVTIEGALPNVKIEKVLISQVFQNLMSNAVKYNDKETGEITVSSSSDGANWLFGVSDNGPGIEEQYFDRIFQIFQTLNARDTVESTGIGLSLVKKTIDHWGGKIWVESEIGTGSTFFFTVPR